MFMIVTLVPRTLAVDALALAFAKSLVNSVSPRALDMLRFGARVLRPRGQRDGSPRRVESGGEHTRSILRTQSSLGP